MRRYFQMSCHALIASAFIALALTGRLDLPAIIIFTLGISGSIWLTLKDRPPLVSALGAFYMSCAYIVFFIFDSLILSRAFVPAIIHMVLFLELAKLYQEKTDKDYLYLIILSFLQILAASSLTIDMTFVATLLLFLGALVSTLMSFDIYRSERKLNPDSGDVAVPLGGMSVWATTWIVVLGTVLFFLIPRIGTGYFSRASTTPLLLSGFNENVELGEIGQVKLNTAVVMRARRINGSSNAVMKWRGVVTDTFDGRRWYRTDRRRRRIEPSAPGQYDISPVDRTGELVSYDILLEPLATTALFAPYRVRSISDRLQDVEADNDESIYIPYQQLRRMQYRVLSEIPKLPRGVSNPDSSEPIPGPIRDIYLQLPPNLDPRIRQLAESITSRGTSMMEKAGLVEAYLRKNYQYTLQLTWDPGNDPIRTFLFEAKTGHCEYFASSMAVLLRAVGIPTRMVTGFQMGEYNPVGDDYIVRESDAHAWIEAYIPGRGWTEYDPTPADLRKDATLATQFAHYVDAAELFWNSTIIIYDSSSQMQLFRSAQEGVQNLQNGFREESDRWTTRMQMFSDRLVLDVRKVVERKLFPGFIALATVGVLVFWKRRALWMAWQIRKIRAGRGVADEAIVEHLFYRAAETVNAPPRQPSQTWREWVLGIQQPELARALEVFEKSKYGHQAISAAEFTILQQFPSLTKK